MLYISGLKIIFSTSEMIKKQTNPIPLNYWKIFGFEALMFAVTLALGILAGGRLKFLVASKTISLSPISIWQLFFSFILGTLALLFVVYFFKFKKPKKIFFKLILWGTVIFGNLFFWSLWLPDIFTLLLLVFLIWALKKQPFVWVFNLAIMLACAGVASALGIQLAPIWVCVMMLIFAVYDFVAVYITKHMVKMAKEMIDQEAVMGFVIPKTAHEFTSPITEIKTEGKFMVLGGGDVVFPLILVVACLSVNLWTSLIVAGASLVGLLFIFLIFATQKTRRPLPALPPIALASVLGYLLTTLWW
ncbi:MAG: presenilin family intramembrane aspartyl protease [Candidatus Gribaldobacteria bacterium]|nr:presenilin family intramembrane aspartyl protease [Candidatus Gribaldobacteria bacterium]